MQCILNATLTRPNLHIYARLGMLIEIDVYDQYDLGTCQSDTSGPSRASKP